MTESYIRFRTPASRADVQSTVVEEKVQLRIAEFQQQWPIAPNLKHEVCKQHARRIQGWC